MATTSDAATMRARGMVKGPQCVRGADQQQLGIGLMLQEAPAGRERDPGAMVPPHAVDSQSSHGLKCRAF